MVKMHRDFWALPVFAGIALGFAGWLQLSILWFLFYTCLGCLALAVAYRWRRWKLTIKREIHSARPLLEAGESVDITLWMKAGGLPWPWLDVRDCLPITLAAGQHGGQLLWLGRTPQAVKYTISDIRRGIHRWDAVAVSSADPLGLVRYQGRFKSSSQLVVYPKTVNLAAWRFFPRRIDGTAKAKTSFTHDLAQLAGIRSYQPGDRLSLIHWKASAKAGRLYSKEFFPLLADSSLVVLDCSAAAWEPGFNPLFEEAVKAAASLVKVAWLQRIPIRFFGNWGQEPEELTIHTQTDFTQFMLHMAAIAPLGTQSLSQSLYNRVLTQGINIVVVTPVVGNKLQRMLYRLSARGNAVTVVRFDGQTSTAGSGRFRAVGSFNMITVGKAEELASWAAGRKAVL